ncbi:MAG: hypothetical protein WCO67_05420 [Betaproteobacteria bacterium]
MLRVVAIALGLASALSPAVAAEEKLNLSLVGAHDLAGRSAYQPVIERQGARWIAYVGHHSGSAVNRVTGANEPNGTSILDVTDTRQSRLLAHIPGQGGGAQMVRACSTLPKAPGRTFILRTLGHSAHEVWETTDPAKPVRTSVVVDGLSDTHKNWWECSTGIAYLVSGAPGWRSSRMMQVYDLSNPAKPAFIRNFGLPGMQPGASGSVPTGLHGPIVAGNRVYMGYGVNSYGVMQVLDREKLLHGPKDPTEKNLLYPQVGRLDLPRHLGAHTAFPILGLEVPEFAKDSVGAKRDFVLVVNEAVTHGCREARQMAWMVDISDEARPFPVSGYTAAEASGGYCGRGRFGAHSSNESFAPVYYRRVVFIAFFNAGVRAVDIRDPLRPVEVGHFVPAGANTNNVEVDERGYVYMADRGSLGLHVLEPTGALRAIAKMP